MRIDYLTLPNGWRSSLLILIICKQLPDSEKMNEFVLEERKWYSDGLFINSLKKSQRPRSSGSWERKSEESESNIVSMISNLPNALDFLHHLMTQLPDERLRSKGDQPNEFINKVLCLRHLIPFVPLLSLPPHTVSEVCLCHYVLSLKIKGFDSKPMRTKRKVVFTFLKGLSVLKTSHSLCPLE